MGAHALEFLKVVEVLKQKLTDRMRELQWEQEDKGLTLSLAGFGFPRPDRYKPFAVCLSNCQDPKTLEPGPVLDHFGDGYFFLPKDADQTTISAFMLHGMTSAIDGTVEANLMDLQKNGAFCQDDPDKVAEALVSIVRQAADHPTYGGYINAQGSSSPLTRRRHRPDRQTCRWNQFMRFSLRPARVETSPRTLHLGGSQTCHL